MANEILWAIGQTMIIQAYSVRGLSVIASLEHLIHRLQFVQYCLYGPWRCRCGHGRATSWSR